MARYALVIGIEQYADPQLKCLSKAVADAEDVAQVLKQFGKYKVTLLTGTVTNQKIAAAFKTLLKQGTNQEIVIYFSGHGVLENSSDSLTTYPPEGFLATSDCRITLNGDQCIGNQNGLKLQSIVKLIKNTQLSNLVFILDTCHSGSLIQEVGKQFEIFSNNTDYSILAACQDYEEAWAKKSDKHSLFTGALLNALQQKYADQDEHIQLGGVADRIYQQLKQTRQEPLCLVKGRSFIFLTYPVTYIIENLPPKEKISPEQITILKPLLEPIDRKILAWVLMESISSIALETWLDDDELMGLDSFLFTIQDKFPRLEDRSISLFKVIETLANHPKVITVIQEKLRQWLENFPDLIFKEESLYNSKITTYLMGVIDQSRPNELFNLTAFLKIADKPPIPIRLRNVTESKPYRKHLQQPYLCRCENWQDIRVWLKDVIFQSENLYLKGCPCGYELNVELFLPFDYLTETIDLWKIREIGRHGRKLGQEYPCLVRSWERLSDGYYENKLKDTWTYLNSLARHCLIDQIKRLEQEEIYDYSELESELIEQQMFGLTCHLPEDFEVLFEALLEAGIPLALWSRPNQCQCQFNQLLNNQIRQPEDFIQAVFRERQEAHRYRQNPQSRWGYHLAMLLDNPSRTPPSQFLRTPGT